MASIEYEFNDIFKAFEDQGINWLNRVENMYKQNGLSFPPDFKQRFIYNSFECMRVTYEKFEKKALEEQLNACLRSCEIDSTELSDEGEVKLKCTQALNNDGDNQPTIDEPKPKIEGNLNIDQVPLSDVIENVNNFDFTQPGNEIWVPVDQLVNEVIIDPSMNDSHAIVSLEGTPENNYDRWASPSISFDEFIEQSDLKEKYDPFFMGMTPILEKSIDITLSDLFGNLTSDIAIAESTIMTPSETLEPSEFVAKNAMNIPESESTDLQNNTIIGGPASINEEILVEHLSAEQMKIDDEMDIAIAESTIMTPSETPESQSSDLATNNVMNVPENESTDLQNGTIIGDSKNIIKETLHEQSSMSRTGKRKNDNASILSPKKMRPLVFRPKIFLESISDVLLNQTKSSEQMDNASSQPAQETQSTEDSIRLGDNNRISIKSKTYLYVKKHKCPSCNYKAAHLAHLKRHMIIHTGERPFPCKICQKKLTTKHNLQSHMKIHIKEFPFGCSKCFEGFYLNDEKKEHEANCIVRCFKCDVCEKFSTLTKVKLIEHMRSHSNDKPFECNQCSMKYKSKYNLIRHRETHTNNKRKKRFMKPSDKNENTMCARGPNK